MPNETPGSERESRHALVTVQPAALELAPSANAEPKLPLGLTRKQIVLALVVAGVSDVVSVFATFAPPVQWGVDIATVLVLFAMLGWRWLLLPALLLEAIPGFGALPFWVLVVGAIAVWGSVRPKLN